MLPFNIADATIYENSIFLDAKIPASQLDLKLLKATIQWEHILLNNPSEEIKKQFPLITKAGVNPEIEYSLLKKNKINMVAWITNLKGFMSLSLQERKNLVPKLLGTLKVFLGLIPYDTDNPKVKNLIGPSNNDIEIVLIINGIVKDDKGNNIRQILPYNLIGQAGYINGEYIFSENYYLKLKIKNGLAVSSEQDKIIIEKEISRKN
jgi:hypothetical protein